MKPSFLLIGLGNPGKSYESTRHNIGFLALDHVARELKAGPWEDKQKFLCTASEAEFDGASLLLVKPTTFMNRSGECIRKLIDFYKLNPASQILVVVDDIDIPLGTHRFRATGGPGTHNGLKSIVESFGENFPRLRIGFGPKPEGYDLASWVLSALSKEEVKAMKNGYEAVLSTVRDVLTSGGR
jgi:PTH1 family peptidyl-tRNA hydrolase